MLHCLLCFLWSVVLSGEYLSHLQCSLPFVHGSLLCRRVAQGGSLVLHWLHTLLLQPDSQLSLFGNGTQSVGGNESNGRWDSSIIESILAAGAGEFDTKGLQQLQQQLLEPGSDLSVIMSNDLKTWLPANPQPKGANQTGSTASEAAAGAAAVSDNMLSVRLAAVRARAAYALLVVAVKQKQPLVVRWLLARLRQQRSWLGQGHCTAEAVLVAQQRIAWSGMLPGFHPPLLALATAVGNKLIAEASGVLFNCMRPVLCCYKHFWTAHRQMQLVTKAASMGADLCLMHASSCATTHLFNHHLSYCDVRPVPHRSSGIGAHTTTFPQAFTLRSSGQGRHCWLLGGLPWALVA